MPTVNAYGATSATKPLTAMSIERRKVDPRDVQIEIKYCGICHSDIHWVRGEMGEKAYPVLPGHEIAGVVTDVGSDVEQYAVGDRVGVGCLVDSCRDCANCAKDEEQYCLKGKTFTYGSPGKDGRLTQGGYSTQIVVDEDFVVRIPDGLALDVAAPLLCAGITTYSPLRHWGVGPGKKVAIVGLGGLGHLAVKIAHAMGSEVTVLSQSLKKQDDGRRLGADHYYATNEPETFQKLARAFDFILNTVSAKVDLDAYLGLLATNGVVVNVGVPPEPFSINVARLITSRLSCAGSMIGGLPETQEMLDFCAEHNVGAEIEVISADKINEAYERVLGSDVRYRFVIDTSTLN